MQVIHKRARMVAPLVALALGAAACGGSDDSSSSKSSGSASSGAAKQGGVFRTGISEPTAIDPYNSQESEGNLVAQALFTRLVETDKDNKLIPGVAQSWSANADCTEWTFKLKPNTHFSNGEVVTAQSFIDGMNRTVAKDAASDVAYHIEGVKGYDEVQAGTATTMPGLTAPDPNTLVMALSAPDCERDKKTYQTVYSPVPKNAGPATNKTYNDLPIGNGPFKMDGPWQHDKSISMVRNDAYDAGNKAHLDRVDVQITGQIEVDYKNFQAGQFDFSRIPPALIPQAKAQYESKGNFTKFEAFGINMLLPMVATKPLNNVDARKAISYAIDRDAVISGVFKGAQTKATSVIPPGFKEVYSPGVCESCEKPDIEKAKQLAISGGIPPGTEVMFGFNTGGGHDAWVQAVAQQLQQNLGLKVTVSSKPFAELLKEQKAPASTGLYRFAWSNDYPTAANILAPLLLTGSGDNRGKYSNPAFDAIIAKASAAKTDAERNPILKQAEKVSIGDDLALIPLWYRTQYRVFDSKFSNVRFDLLSEDPVLAEVSQK